MRKRVWKSIENYTLTKKILVAFLIVTIPLTTVLFGVTAYSQNVIQKEVSRSNQTLLDSCIRQIDTRLQEADAYLDKVKFRSSSEISWSYADETEYILMLQTLRNQLRRDLVSASPADALFIYDSARQRSRQNQNLEKNFPKRRFSGMFKSSDHRNLPGRFRKKMQACSSIKPFM